jgi:uncharacterized membrane protein
VLGRFGDIRMKWFYFAVAAAAGALIFATSAKPASAGTPLTVCNQTSVDLTVAAGYHSSGVNDTAGSNILTGPFVSHGWVVIAPGKCETRENPFNARYMFWWAINHAGLNVNGAVWATNGNDHFCVPNLYGSSFSGAFTFEDENASEAACEKGHFSQNGPNVWVSVRSVDLMVNPTVNFTGQ